MKGYYLLMLVVGLVCSCDKASELGQGKGDEGESEPSQDDEEEAADEPKKVEGGFCTTWSEESHSFGGMIECDLSGPSAPFKLPAKLRAETLHVAVDGIEIPSDRFTYDRETGYLTILEDVSGKKITISWSDGEDLTPSELTTGKIVDLSGLDGCRLMIELVDGKRLEPLNLPPEFAHPGMKVKFKYTVPGEVASICMAGKIVNVSEMIVDSTDCATLTLVMESVLTELGNEPNFCATDDDCVGVGGGKTSCEIPHGVTTAAATAARVERYLKAETSFVSSCPMAQAQAICPGTKTVHCTNAVCTGVLE